jgi:hypothetical protein
METNGVENDHLDILKTMVLHAMNRYKIDLILQIAEREAEKCGVSLLSVCKRAGVSKSQRFDEWLQDLHHHMENDRVSEDYEECGVPLKLKARALAHSTKMDSEAAKLKAIDALWDDIVNEVNSRDGGGGGDGDGDGGTPPAPRP